MSTLYGFKTCRHHPNYQYWQGNHLECPLCVGEAHQRLATAQQTRLVTALQHAVDVLDNVRGNINPERGYAQELEAEIQQAYENCRAALAQKKP